MARGLTDILEQEKRGKGWIIKVRKTHWGHDCSKTTCAYVSVCVCIQILLVIKV